MKKLIIISGIVLALTGAMAQSVTVNIQAVNVAQDTGIYVTKGEAITINANGNWSWAGEPDGVSDNIFGEGLYVPDGLCNGDGDIFLNNGIQDGLVAYIGTHSPFVDDSGNPIQFQYPVDTGFWQIGSSRQFISPANGYLWLCIQDDANSHVYSDNHGSVNAQIFLGNGAANSDWTDIRPDVNVSLVSDVEFGFTVTSAKMPNSFWAVYDSTDLKNWVLVGALTLDDSGNGSFTSSTGVPYRFYKISNGQTVSRTIGFERLTVKAPINGQYAGAGAFIVDQVQASTGNSTLGGIFNYTTLPTGSEVLIWNGQSFDIYTYTANGWINSAQNPADGLVINFNQAVFLKLPTGGDDVIVNFTGLVPEGQLTWPLYSATGRNMCGSMLPKVGGISSVLGLSNADGSQDGLFVCRWNGNSYDMVVFDSSLYTGFGNSAGTAAVPEPIINIGEGMIISDAEEDAVWIQDYTPTF